MEAPRRPTNRLATEASPYLQQHAENPVDWYPWGDEALAAAKARDVPILLSIGYSACHWCHVMERESFEDAETAALMNAHFVNVKVDREERPDLDQIYQLVVQLLGRSGGWPLTVFLTPDQKPFFGGTYFPPEERYGMPSFRKVLAAIADAYATQREEVALQAGEIAEAIAGVSRGDGVAGGVTLGPELLARAAEKLAARFDDEHGGFGLRPKFPSTMSVDVLLQRGALDGDDKARLRARHALEAMQRGGIYDHVGGGFHRYSTDERWLVPHFEKMLYDNALLLRLYADGFRVFGDEGMRRTVTDVAAYLRREMTAPGGAFFATQDADSEGEEGKFFVWSPDEVRAALGPDTEAADVALLYFGVTTAGNFEQTGKSVLHEAAPVATVALKLGMAPSAVAGAIERARRALFTAREGRVRPFRDEKILASWNGLAVSGLAAASMALGDEDLLAMARRAFAFVEATLTEATARGRRVHRLVKDGVRKGPGFLDDHAFVADAALDLYDATGEARYVIFAREVADAILACFADTGADGGFFFTADDGEALLHRGKDAHDQAIPSGTAIACRALLRLGALLGERYAAPARREVERLAGAAAENPFGLGQMICNAGALIRGTTDVVLVGPRGDEALRRLARAAHRAYLPHRVLAWADGTDGESLAACAALAEGKPMTGAPAAYVCRGRACSLPVTTEAELTTLLAATP